MEWVLYSFADLLYVRACIEIVVSQALLESIPDPLHTRVCIEMGHVKKTIFIRRPALRADLY